MFYALLISFLSIVSIGLSAEKNTWEQACNGVIQYIPVRANDSFNYPDDNAPIKTPLANNCQLLFQPDPGVVLSITISGSYDPKEFSIVEDHQNVTVSSSNTFRIPSSGFDISVNINKALALSGTLVLQVNGLEVGDSIIPEAPSADAYSLIFPAAYNMRKPSPTFAVMAPDDTFNLIYFFCFAPDTTPDQASNLLFYDATLAYIGTAAPFFVSNTPLISISRDQVFYNTDSTLSGVIVVYASKNPDWDIYTSQPWSGSFKLKNQNVVFGRLNGDTNGAISIDSMDAATTLIIYSGVAEFMNNTAKVVYNCTGANIVPPTIINLPYPVITVMVTGGFVHLTMINTVIPTTTQAAMVTTTMANGHATTTAQAQPPTTTAAPAPIITTTVAAAPTVTSTMAPVPPIITPTVINANDWTTTTAPPPIPVTTSQASFTLVFAAIVLPFARFL